MKREASHLTCRAGRPHADRVGLRGWPGEFKPVLPVRPEPEALPPSQHAAQPLTDLLRGDPPTSQGSCSEASAAPVAAAPAPSAAPAPDLLGGGELADELLSGLATWPAAHSTAEAAVGDNGIIEPSAAETAFEAGATPDVWAPAPLAAPLVDLFADSGSPMAADETVPLPPPAAASEVGPSSPLSFSPASFETMPPAEPSGSWAAAAAVLDDDGMAAAGETAASALPVADTMGAGCADPLQPGADPLQPGAAIEGGSCPAADEDVGVGDGEGKQNDAQETQRTQADNLGFQYRYSQACFFVHLKVGAELAFPGQPPPFRGKKIQVPDEVFMIRNNPVSMKAFGLGLVAVAASTAFVFGQDSEMVAKGDGVTDRDIEVNDQLRQLQDQLQTFGAANAALKAQFEERSAALEAALDRITALEAAREAPTASKARRLQDNELLELDPNELSGIQFKPASGFVGDVGAQPNKPQIFGDSHGELYFNSFSSGPVTLQQDIMDKIASVSSLQANFSLAMAEITASGPALGKYIGMRLYKFGSSTACSGSSIQKITLDKAVLASSTGVDQSDAETNSRFKPTIAGFYSCTARTWSFMHAEVQDFYIYKNGVAYSMHRHWVPGVSTGDVSLEITDILQLDGVNDYVEMFQKCDGSIGAGDARATYLACHFIGQADTTIAWLQPATCSDITPMAGESGNCIDMWSADDRIWAQGDHVDQMKTLSWTRYTSVTATDFPSLRWIFWQRTNVGGLYGGHFVRLTLHRRLAVIVYGACGGNFWYSCTDCGACDGSCPSQYTTVEQSRWTAIGSPSYQVGGCSTGKLFYTTLDAGDYTFTWNFIGGPFFAAPTE